MKRQERHHVCRSTKCVIFVAAKVISSRLVHAMLTVAHNKFRNVTVAVNLAGFA